MIGLEHCLGAGSVCVCVVEQAEPPLCLFPAGDDEDQDRRRANTPPREPGTGPGRNARRCRR